MIGVNAVCSDDDAHRYSYWHAPSPRHEVECGVFIAQMPKKEKESEFLKVRQRLEKGG
jgi:hypothetical protein